MHAGYRSIRCLGYIFSPRWITPLHFSSVTSTDKYNYSRESCLWCLSEQQSWVVLDGGHLREFSFPTVIANIAHFEPLLVFRFVSGQGSPTGSGPPSSCLSCLLEPQFTAQSAFYLKAFWGKQQKPPLALLPTNTGRRNWGLHQIPAVSLKPDVISPYLTDTGQCLQMFASSPIQKKKMVQTLREQQLIDVLRQRGFISFCACIFWWETIFIRPTWENEPSSRALVIFRSRNEKVCQWKSRHQHTYLRVIDTSAPARQHRPF